MAVLRTHLELLCPDGDPHALAFTRDNGRRIETTSFLNEARYPTRAAVFLPDPQLPPDDPRQPELSRLRLHDLRHAACWLWLHAGMRTKLCQRWSGHRQLSVFLDVHAGVISGSEEEGIKALERALLRPSETT